ncbi:SET domain-containing protein [Eremomyces bilateralis CBS 781.70]|uniref:SET domain-containing protein n=1 Tax=Eremomyces bilateralis CBS 781.70 TaxID=1392243 RepID=A0A6G1G9P8_9PEZI|nr:SET domain-containing protein [Eremomyces bilateralis CBS 781.70]KAF1814589.1 SET domain-containing protein [Eremomyces bilateralis CBS 781.70]
MVDRLEGEMSLARCPDIYLVLNTPKGRGVVARSHIPARTILDVCPVLVLSLEDNEKHIKHTELFHYTYNWPHQDEKGILRMHQAICFGLGSMFNHSHHNQNVVWERDQQSKTITYRAARDIPPGEELCISYGSHLTFTDADSPEGEEEPELLLDKIQI